MKNFILPDKTNISVTNVDDPLEYYYRFIVGYYYRQRIENCLELIPGRDYRNVLEIGTGSGIMIPSLARFADKVCAFDIHDNLKSVSDMLKKEEILDNCNR